MFVCCLDRHYVGGMQCSAGGIGMDGEGLFDKAADWCRAWGWLGRLGALAGFRGLVGTVGRERPQLQGMTGLRFCPSAPEF